MQSNESAADPVRLVAACCSVLLVSCGQPPSPERCNSVDDDGDGQVDESTDSARICVAIGADEAQCVAGRCRIVACSSGFADCNETFDDGCETSIVARRESCGGCGVTCAAGEACVEERCVSAIVAAAGGAGLDVPGGIAVDGSDGVVLAGVFTGEATFGPELRTADDTPDLFVWSLDAALGHRWVQVLTATAPSGASDVAVDDLDDVYIVGRFQDSLTLDAAVLRSGSIDQQRAFVASIGVDGSPNWLMTPVPPAVGAVAFSAATSVALGPSGLLVGGNYADRGLDGSIMGFVESIDWNGAETWDEGLGALAVTNVDDIAVGGDTLWVGGQFSGNLDIDASVPNVRSESGFDAFVASYAVDGTARTLSGFVAGSTDERAASLLARDDGSVVTVVWGEGMRLVVQAPDGSVAREVAIGGFVSGPDSPIIAAAPDGFVVVGRVDGSVTIDREEIVSVDDAVIAILGFDRAGGPLGVSILGGSESATPIHATSASDSLIIAGYFTGALEITERRVESRGGPDAFVLRLGLW